MTDNIYPEPLSGSELFRGEETFDEHISITPMDNYNHSKSPMQAKGNQNNAEI